MNRSSGADDGVPVRVVSVQPPGTGPALWVPEGPRPDGQDVETQYLATEVPGIPGFERELPTLRAGGTGQTCTGVAESVPAPEGFGACDGDGD